MGIMSAVKRWWNGLFSKQSIKNAFGVEIAVSPLMTQMRALYLAIVRGTAPWNEEAPSLRLAGAISAEVARKVVVGLESEIFGGERDVQDAQGETQSERLMNPRSDYLNEQYTRFKGALRFAVIAACNGGEVIFKPCMVEGGIDVTVCETNCYWELAYNVRDELIDVVFGATTTHGGTVYNLLERHAYDETARAHEITYRAFRQERSAHEFTPDHIGEPVSLSEIPEWAHLQDMTIQNIGQPLFARFVLPSSDIVETPQRQGLPIWSKAVDLLRKADMHENRTDWEFEGGELAIHASIDMFRPNTGAPARRPGHGQVDNGAAQGVALPKGRERAYRLVEATAEAFKMEVFSPEFRIDGLDKRMNQILRRIEFLSGLSYGILSDVNNQDKTAEEIRSSKDRFFTTVSDIQQALQKTLEHLIKSLDVLADLQGVPQGAYDVTFTWDDSIMADREREFDERIRGQAAGWLSDIENRAWYLGADTDSAEAQNVPGMASEY